MGSNTPGNESDRKPVLIFVDVAKQAFASWRNDGASSLAASLSFYTIFSLAPALLIALAVAGVIVGHEAARKELVGELSPYVGSDGAGFMLALLDRQLNKDDWPNGYTYVWPRVSLEPRYSIRGTEKRY